MQLYRFACWLIATAFIFSACKKNDASQATEPDDSACVTQVSITASITGNESQYIVIYKSAKIGTESGKVRTESVLARNGIDRKAIRKTLDGDLSGCVIKLTPDVAALLKADDNVEMIEPDRVIALSTCFTVVEPRLITWNVAKVGYGDGRGKTAWIIDTGIDFDHPDLNVDKTRSRSFINGQNSAEDSNGHGTHVAGIIGALNNRIGVLGVASGANLVACKVLDGDGQGVLSDIIDALNYVGQNAKAGDVVNMSLGLDGPSNILDRMVTSVAAKGILFAIAAGNESTTAKSSSPARVNAPNVYTVSAIDSSNNFAKFSNYGNDVVDYAAPGVQIVSTYLNGRYARLSGTSMAAPHVAGLLLLTGGMLHSSGTAMKDPDGVPDPIASK